MAIHKNSERISTMLTLKTVRVDKHNLVEILQYEGGNGLGTDKKK